MKECGILWLEEQKRRVMMIELIRRLRNKMLDSMMLKMTMYRKDLAIHLVVEEGVVMQVVEEVGGMEGEEVVWTEMQKEKIGIVHLAQM